MSAGTEVELKFELDPLAMAEILADPIFSTGDVITREQVSTYFDTPAGDIRQAALSLRIRRIGKRRVQTVKADDERTTSLFARDEWERDIAGDTPDIGHITALAEALGGNRPQRPSPIFVVNVRRTSVVRTQGTSRIELVADQGSLIAGDRHCPVLEIELELLDGDRLALFALAREIGRRVPLRLGVRSKSERGYALLDGTAAPSVKAEPVRVAADMEAGTAFGVIASACLRHFRLNEDKLLATGRPQPLHQARVALRRLRSALSIFKDILAGPEHDRLRAELRWISGLLGDVRNIDVMIARIEDRKAIRQLRAARKRRHAALVEALDSPRMRSLMLDLAEWIAIGSWRDDDAAAALRATPAPVFAHKVLGKLRRRLKKRGRHLARLDESERHEIRIIAKKLRYAAEFFAELYPGKKPKRRREAFLAATEDLQTILGELNDLASGRTLLAALGVADPDDILATGQRHDPDKLMANAEDAYDALFDVQRFWR